MIRRLFTALLTVTACMVAAPSVAASGTPRPHWNPAATLDAAQVAHGEACLIVGLDWRGLPTCEEDWTY